MRKFEWLDRRRDYAALFIRLIVAAILIEGTADNVFSSERMLEFEKFIAANGVPLAKLGAYVSAWSQFVCGFLILFGVATRFAGFVMVLNFLFALGIAHRGAPLFSTPTRLALCMLFMSIFLMIYGAGRPSIDEARARKMPA